MNTGIIKNPRITEKGSMKENVYLFNVTKSASKAEIKKAIFTLYKVKPVRVNVLSVPKRRVNFRGKMNLRSGGRKAYVYLKKGDKIELA
jgi:large subunit ribosomal protein L23